MLHQPTMHTTQITLGQAANGHQQIALGGGCFWCVEGVFQRVRGIVGVESGYCNGHVPNPTYEQVCTGNTGHAEVVVLSFDPTVITTQDILHIFFDVHDATTLNRQGNDVGTQYRSGIYCTTPGQLDVATGVISDLQSARPALQGMITTEVAMLEGYTAGESYHQNYFENNPSAGYCAYIIRPKVDKFTQTHQQFLA